jgi:ribosomal-protein-alanine N-acetyltransferase
VQFQLIPMEKNYAYTIANWHYEDIYAFYDLSQDVEDQQEFLDSNNWEGHYYAVVNNAQELIGYFSFEFQEEAIIVGLGLKPSYTGKELGTAFVTAGLGFAIQHFHPKKFCLEVATFNERAIRVYEKVGFILDHLFMNRTNGGDYEFAYMVYEISEKE